MSISSQCSIPPLQQSRELPRLFKPHLIRAIINGQKTETRQPIKPQPIRGRAVSTGAEFVWKNKTFQCTYEDFQKQLADMCPIGRAGDKLWIKETIYGCHEQKIRKDAPKNWDSSRSIYDLGDYWYAADDIEDADWTVYTSAIHCPRWAARLILEITEVRVERLQDITGEDIFAEGLRIYEGERVSLPSEGKLVAEMYRDQFAKLWNGIYPDYSWNRNPFVWVQKFKVIQGGGV